MYVYKRIKQRYTYSENIYVRSRYMYVYVCIWLYLHVYCCFQYTCIASTAWKFVYVCICMHLPVYVCLKTLNPKRLCRIDLAHPTTRHASRAPGDALSFLTEVSHARSAHYKPVPWPVTADLVGWRPSRGPRASAAPPQKHLLTAIQLCLYM